MLTEIEKGINDRFFQALQSLIDSGEVRTVQQFTTLHDINRWSLVSMRNDNGARKIVAMKWLVTLVKHYGISAKWLLIGEGRMKTSKTPTRKQGSYDRKKSVQKQT